VGSWTAGKTLAVSALGRQPPAVRASSEGTLAKPRKREHSRKPDEQYEIIEACSPGPYLELFARGVREGWKTWGNEADADYHPSWPTYAHHSRAG